MRCSLALALALTLALGSPGCASAIASSLGATGASAAAARQLDGAMMQAAMHGLASGGETHTTSAAPSGATFGSEPSFSCTIPGELDPQTLAASSLEGAVRSCGAMNAMPPHARCTCRELELGSSLAGPLAER